MYISLNDKPDVSIVMPVLNGEKNHITETLESISSQSYGNFEFIIIDDGSTDNTYAIVSDFSALDKRLKLIKNEKNLGIVESINKGIKQASSRFIARMDCGDVADKRRVALQYGFLKEHKDYVLVSSQVEWISMSGEKLFTTRHPSSDFEIRKRLFSKDCILLHPTVMFRLTGNLYYRNIIAAEDYDYWLRLSMYGKLYIIDKPLIKVRLNPNGTTYSRKIEQVKSVDIVHKYFISSLKGFQESYELHTIRLSKIEMLQQRLFHKFTRYAITWRQKSIAAYCALKWLSVIVSPYYMFELIQLRVRRFNLQLNPLFERYLSRSENRKLTH